MWGGGPSRRTNLEIQRNDNFQRAMNINFLDHMFRASLAPYSSMETTADEC